MAAAWGDGVAVGLGIMAGCVAVGNGISVAISWGDGVGAAAGRGQAMARARSSRMARSRIPPTSARREERRPRCLTLPKMRLGV
jgi:hypothetical protein